MRTSLLCSLALLCDLASAQELKIVSNSDNDQRKHQQVLASRLLSWSTGSEEQINYVSVGRYANYFGFVKMRVSSAHSLKRSETGRETLSVLSETQRSTLFDLLDTQAPLIQATHSSRLQANKVLKNLLNGDETGRASFLDLASQYATSEAELGILLATGFADIISTLTPQQKIELASVRDKHTSGRAGKVHASIREIRGLTQNQKQEAFNLAARLLSWTTGDLEDFSYETIGKPSQHFGFVSMRIESNHGVKRGVLADEALERLTGDQREQLYKAATADAQNLKAYLTVREEFLSLLSTLKDNGATDLVALRDLAASMATYEAKMSWDQAIAMKQILDSFTDSQSKSFLKLRNKYVPLQKASGAELYQQCAACHQNSQIAPDLNSIINRPIASTKFDYSPAMSMYSESNPVWSEELLKVFLKNPQKSIPGTTMSFKGIDDDESLKSLVEYLDQ